MIKMLRALRAEHKKLWNKRTAAFAPLLVLLLSFLITGTGAGLHEWSGSLPSKATNPILADVMYHTERRVSETDLAKYYTDTANDAAERLVEIKSKIEFTTGRERYAMERERAMLLQNGGAARFRVQYGVNDEDSFTGQLTIFTMWLLMPLIAVFAVLYASDMFAGEFERGTVRMTLCRPVTRIRQYFAKHLTAGMYSTLLLLCAGGGALASAVPSQGWDLDKAYVGLLNGSVYKTTWLLHVAAAFACCLTAIEMCVMLCAFIGNALHTRTASAVLPIAILFAGLLLGSWIGAADSTLPGFSIFCCIDLVTPLCGIGNSVRLGFSEYAASLGIHMVACFICGYAAFRSDIK